MIEISLDAAEAGRVLRSSGAPHPAALAPLLGSGPRKLLGRAAGPGYAMLAADQTERHAAEARAVVRCFALLEARPAALAAFDLIVPSAGSVETVWKMTGSLARTELRSGAGPGDRIYLNVLDAAARPGGVREAGGIDLAGAVCCNWAVLFHTESHSARSPLFFTAPQGASKFLLIGLAPGDWDVWRDGFLEAGQGIVQPEEASLYFEGPAGTYFLRKR